MPSRTSVSPSPPPQAPVASTPGLRAAALHKIFTTALTSTLKANSYANFSACFPTPAGHCPSALEGVWKQLNTKLEEGCQREFETLLQERGVVEGLNQWDSQIEDARRRLNRSVDGETPQRPHHTLSAEELYTAHLTPYLRQATETLEQRLLSTQEENQVLTEKVMAQIAEIEKMVSGLEGVVRDLEGAGEVMSTGAGVNGLKAETWEMDAEVRAAS